MTRLFIFLMICWLADTDSIQADNHFNLNSRRISVQDGLLGNTVNELAQDAEGYIWMATNNGLTRYDGYSTVNYTSLSSTPHERMEARIGRIVNDERSHLLWMSTATYMNACYDLSQARFVDWTGCGETRRQLNKFFLSPSGRGMFFYGNNQGVRRSECKKGQNGRLHFNIADYTAAEGLLPDNDVLMLLEDSAANVFIPTKKGLAVLPGNGTRPQIVLHGMGFVSAATNGESTYLLTDKGEVYVVNRQLRPTLCSKLPGAMGPVTKVNVSFLWQGRWMLFTPQGTLCMDMKTGHFERTEQYQIVNGLNQGEQKGYHFVANHDGRLCIYPDKGSMRQLDLIPKAHFSNMRGRKFHIATDHEGRLFIATYGNGLFVWNPGTDELRHFTAEDPNPIIRTNYLIYCICDRDGCIWLGSEATGAYCLSIMTGARINYMLPEPQHLGDRANAVSALAQKRDGHIIIGTREGGIYEYDITSGHIFKKDERRSNITGSFVDRDNHNWICTNGEGLFVDMQQYQKGDPQHPLPENNVSQVLQDAKGRIWVGTWNGGLLMTEGVHEGRPTTFHQFLNSEMNESRIKALAIDKKGMLYVGTNNGIYTLDTHQDNIADMSFHAYNTSNGRFDYDEVFCLYVATDSTLWVGAAGSGAMKCRLDGDKLVCERITTRQGLANNNVYSIAEDDYGYVWVGTEEGISRINTRNNIVSTYQPSPVLQGNVATENCALRTKEGQLLFGTNYGVVLITPTPNVLRPAQQVHASITDLHVNGLSIYESDGLALKPELLLDHNQNSLSFFFSNFNYSGTQASLYQYFLEGFETDWLPMTTDNHADYVELHPGTYVFHLRSLSSDNEWQAESTLTITIRQPWYNTWWAWLLYLLTALLMGWYIWNNWKEKFDLHQQMKLERQLTDFRVQFFTHITHEFRTPLAIIKGAIDKLQGDRATLQTAQRGTQRLLRLVNQFMEFRKVNTGNLHLHVSKDDIVGFVKVLCQDFWPLGEQKNIQTTFTPFARQHVMYFDQEIVETIVYNLLSNAIKYTPEGGSVTMQMKLGEGRLVKGEGNTLQIIVEDTGPGINAQQQAALFKPFMQGLASQGGMGIGLYTAHEMARVHHGSLEYQDTTSVGGGSRFTLTIPAHTDVYNADEMNTEPTEKQEKRENSEAEAIIRQMQPEALNEQTVAIIEDDPDMMEQIRTELGVYFHIVAYANGRQAYESISEGDLPSIIISDVMLPDMDGYEIVQRLKSQSHTACVPIIMLTALDDEAHQIRAYKAGADDYMVKPCNWRLLVARTMQLIKWNTLDKEDMAKGDGKPLATHENHLITTQADKVFLDRLAMHVAQHMREETLNVDQLAQLMAMGRTKFYGRVKELTGLSPNRYLMQERMKKAADLLADGELTVSEVSYQVGIQDPSYFNKCFKAQYGVTPSKYVKPA